MAINLTNVLSQIETRHTAIDSNTDATEHTRLDAINDRINSMGGVLTYRSTGHLPEMVDSGYVGTIAYVTADNVFGDSSGAFYMGTFKDSNWVRVATKQDSDEAAIEAPGGALPTTPYQGSNFGYRMGGSVPNTNVIDKYSYASDGDATDVGNMTRSQSSSAGGGSETHGYIIAGSPNDNTIAKFSYTTDGNATDTGYNIKPSDYGGQGQPEMLGDRTNIYVIGQNPVSNEILTFSAASDGSTITDYGDLIATTRLMGSGSSATHGYGLGGRTPTDVNTIQKFPFASAANATDIGDLLDVTYGTTGTSSGTHGYAVGGFNPPANRTNVIQKYSFSTDGDATDAADITAARGYMGSTSSTTHGYVHGGNEPALVNTIEKFPYAADANATDVGDLTNSTAQVSAGTHY